MSFPSVILHQQKTHALRRYHPWVFSGAIKKKPATMQDGDITGVYSDNGEYLGTGYYGPGSIAIRIFSFQKVEPDELPALWIKKFTDAYQVRAVAGLTQSSSTNAYRLINAEGDGIPGLIIDWYNGTAVIQAHSIGMYLQKENFVAALQIVYGEQLHAVYDKSSGALHTKPDTTGGKPNAADSYLFGASKNETILENNLSFKVSWEQGQKTGFFIDQRDNRALLAKYAAGKKFLNTFCYSGGFSVYAAQAGAAEVHSVDSSARAIDWTNQNMELNGFALPRHKSVQSDIFEFLKTADNDYDLMVLDPPAFAKGQSARHSAIKAYTRLNRTAIDKIKSGGILFTFSCSQAVSPEMFTGAVTAAAIESGRNIRILHHLTQPADHPVSVFHPEGLYLKGLVLYIE